MSGEKCSIIGSGKIGQCWAILFGSAGYNVSLHDVSQERLDAALKAIEVSLHELEEGGLMRGNSTVPQVLARITTETSIEACIAGAHYVQECVFEKLELKQEIFHSMTPFLDADTVVASSTSTIAPSLLSADLPWKERFVVAHPVNPPILCPLVEIVPASWTSARATERAEKIMKASGQEPVVLKKEVTGFAVNRLQYALVAECWRLVCDGVLSAEDVDKVVSRGLGMRWAFFGPLEVTGINGEGVVRHNEIYGEGFAKVCNSFGPPPDLKDPQLQSLAAQQIDSRHPREQMEARRAWRDKALMGLVELKKKLEEAP